MDLEVTKRKLKDATMKSNTLMTSPTSRASKIPVSETGPSPRHSPRSRTDIENHSPHQQRPRSKTENRSRIGRALTEDNLSEAGKLVGSRQLKQVLLSTIL